MSDRIARLALAALLASLASTALAEGDPESGKRVFAKCAACHAISDDRKHKIGPNLFGLIGRVAGSAEGYSYSRAMMSSGIVWSAESLDRYLSNPRKAVPGNKMPFPGLKSATDRSDVIAYLAQTSSR